MKGVGKKTFGVSSPQPEKYFNKAVEETSKIMESGLFKIYTVGSYATD